MLKATFSPEQANHAAQVVLQLMKRRRIFLCTDAFCRLLNNPNHWLNHDIFSEALILNGDIHSHYMAVRQRGEEDILSFEKKHEITAPKTREGEQIVQCNLITGGLNICIVLPITDFTRYAPSSLALLKKEMYEHFCNGKTEDDLSPKKVRKFLSKAEELASTIWGQLETMKAQDPDSVHCVVVMATQFLPHNYDENNDFMEGRLTDMQNFLEAMGYLFHAFLLHNSSLFYPKWIVFNAPRESHVSLRCKRGKRPVITYGAKGGFRTPNFFISLQLCCEKYSNDPVNLAGFFLSFLNTCY